MECGAREPSIPPWADMNIGHGTCVASVAAELQHGASKSVQLIPVKYGEDGCKIKYLGILRGFSLIRDSIKADEIGVIVMSWLSTNSFIIGGVLAANRECLS